MLFELIFTIKGNCEDRSIVQFSKFSFSVWRLIFIVWCVGLIGTVYFIPSLFLPDLEHERRFVMCSVLPTTT
jgi:hypothetical protein